MLKIDTLIFEPKYMTGFNPHSIRQVLRYLYRVGVPMYTATKLKRQDLLSFYSELGYVGWSKCDITDCGQNFQHKICQLIALSEAKHACLVGIDETDLNLLKNVNLTPILVEKSPRKTTAQTWGKRYIESYSELLDTRRFYYEHTK